MLATLSRIRRLRTRPENRIVLDAYNNTYRDSANVVYQMMRTRSDRNRIHSSDLLRTSLRTFVAKTDAIVAMILFRIHLQALLGQVDRKLFSRLCVATQSNLGRVTLRAYV